MLGGFLEPREEGRVEAQLNNIDLYYQIRDLHECIEQRFSEQEALLQRLQTEPLVKPVNPASQRTGPQATVQVMAESPDAPETEYISPVKSPRPEWTSENAAKDANGTHVSVQNAKGPPRAGSHRSSKASQASNASNRPSNTSRQSVASVGIRKTLVSLGSAMMDENGIKLRERAKRQAKRLRESRGTSLALRNSEKTGPCRLMAGKIVSSPWFSNGIMVMILINVILLGVEVDVAGQVGVQDIPAWLSIANAIFVTIFVLELMLRFAAVGWTKFWCGEDFSWNIFDFFVIFVSVVDVCIDYLAIWLSPSVNTQNLRLVRSIRLARALRGIRIVWLFEYVGALRTLALSIISTSGSLFWTIVILLILIYSFGVVTTQLVVEHCRVLAVELQQDPNASPQCPESLSRYWKDVPTSMLTLFASISGGLDWESAIQALMEVSGWAVALVLCYVTIAVFAVLNVVIGVFCNTAIENAASDKELASIKQVYTKQNQVQTLKKIFYEIDAAGTNEVSIEDLEEAMTHGELSSFLESMGISTDDVWTLCILLDTDRSGTIDLDEFVTGCMQLHGPAKSMQMAKMSFENRASRRVLKQVAQDIHVVKHLLNSTAVNETF